MPTKVLRKNVLHQVKKGPCHDATKGQKISKAIFLVLNSSYIVAWDTRIEDFCSCFLEEMRTR